MLKKIAFLSKNFDEVIWNISNKDNGLFLNKKMPLFLTWASFET